MNDQTDAAYYHLKVETQNRTTRYIRCRDWATVEQEMSNAAFYYSTCLEVRDDRGVIRWLPSLGRKIQ